MGGGGGMYTENQGNIIEREKKEKENKRIKSVKDTKASRRGRRGSIEVLARSGLEEGVISLPLLGNVEELLLLVSLCGRGVEQCYLSCWLGCVSFICHLF